MWLRTEPLLGSGGITGATGVLWEGESGVSCKSGGGGASSELQAGAETQARAGGGHICTGAGAHLHEKELPPARVPATLPAAPTPIGARARAQPRWLADTRSRCLPWLAPTLPPPTPRGSRIQKVR